LSFADIVSLTHDGAAVMKKYGRIIPSESQICHNHGIHLGITDVLFKKPKIMGNNIDATGDADSDVEETDEEGINIADSADFYENSDEKEDDCDSDIGDVFENDDGKPLPLQPTSMSALKDSRNLVSS
jgi:hypothetical protein